METIRLGKTNMIISRLGFGGIPIQRVTEDEAIAVVRKCLERGITFLDTANAYTTSEERIGKAIARQRDRLTIATKTGARDRAGAEKHLKLSLQHLQTKYIDLYQFHGVNDLKSLDMVLSLDGPMTMAKEAKRAGTIRHIGITSHQMDVAKKAIQSDLFETIMFPFNFITHEASDQLLPLARKHNVGFIAMKPLAGGMLSNITIAFKYLLQFPDIVAIPGIEKVPEIEEIVQVFKGSREITQTEQLEMQRLRKELGTKFCHRCDYCQPCNNEIQISNVLTINSFAKRLPADRLFSGWLVGAMEKASNCTECGECEERCPYHLPIREMIAQNVKWYHDEKKKYEQRVSPRQAKP